MMRGPNFRPSAFVWEEDGLWLYLDYTRPNCCLPVGGFAHREACLAACAEDIGDNVFVTLRAPTPEERAY